jgi:membrane protease YdiL (CAAX protease family)
VTDASSSRTQNAIGLTGAGPSHVLAPRVTRAAAFTIMGGILLQAAIAGGFLAGHDWNDLHMALGGVLIVSALVVLGVGLIGRRSRLETRSLLMTRIGVLIVLLATAIVGLVAGQGTRDLLMMHIPLAIISMGLSARLAGAMTAGRSRRDGPPVRS